MSLLRCFNLRPNGNVRRGGGEIRGGIQCDRAAVAMATSVSIGAGEIQQVALRFVADGAALWNVQSSSETLL